jgi:hypothetical protein
LDAPHNLLASNAGQAPAIKKAIMSRFDDADDWDPFEECPQACEGDDELESTVKSQSQPGDASYESAPLQVRVDVPGSSSLPAAAPHPVQTKQQSPQSAATLDTDIDSRTKYENRKRKVEDARLDDTAKLKEVKRKTAFDWRRHLQQQQQMRSDAQPVVAAQPSEGGAYSKIHASHRRVSIKQIVFCKTCGCWMANKIQKLSQPCQGAPTTSGVKGALKRMLKGIHPDSKVKQWPDGTDSRQAAPLVNLDP